MKCDKKDLLLYAVTDRQLAEWRDTLHVQVEKSAGRWSYICTAYVRNIWIMTHFLQEAKEIKELCAKIPGTVCDQMMMWRLHWQVERRRCACRTK